MRISPLKDPECCDFPNGSNRTAFPSLYVASPATSYHLPGTESDRESHCPTGSIAATGWRSFESTIPREGPPASASPAAPDQPGHSSGRLTPHSATDRPGYCSTGRRKAAKQSRGPTPGHCRSHRKWSVALQSDKGIGG